MFFSIENVLPINRTKPADGISLRKGQLVWHLNFLEGAIAQKLVITHPAAVRVQSNPRTGKGCKRPTRPMNFP